MKQIFFIFRRLLAPGIKDCRSQIGPAKLHRTLILALCMILCFLLFSVPYWMNFAMVSISRKLRELTFNLRGYQLDETVKNHRNIKADGVAWSNMSAGRFKISMSKI